MNRPNSSADVDACRRSAGSSVYRTTRRRSRHRHCPSSGMNCPPRSCWLSVACCWGQAVAFFTSNQQPATLQIIFRIEGQTHIADMQSSRRWSRRRLERDRARSRTAFRQSVCLDRQIKSPAESCTFAVTSHCLPVRCMPTDNAKSPMRSPRCVALRSEEVTCRR